jgi:hypothetical protein
MERICVNELKTILKQSFGGVCVSIFMPTQNEASGTDPQNIIRFKNLLHKAEEKLVTKGLRSAEARSLLQPAENLLTDKPFWIGRNKGLAFYLDTTHFFYYKVPTVLQEFVNIGTRFSVKSLIPLLGDCGIFYLLALSQKENRLLQCTEVDSVKLDLKDIPRNLAESMHTEVPDSRIGYRSSSSKTLGSESFQVFGSSSMSDINKIHILKYFEEINKGINQILRQENAPLILAGVDFLLPLYRSVNKYPNLLNEGIVGNPDSINEQSLCEQGWRIVKPYFDKARNDAISELNKNIASGRIAYGESEVIPAAFNGRVRYLFVAEDSSKWGTYDVSTNMVTVHSSEEKNDEDLIDLAVFHTLKNDGTVYSLQPENMQGSKSLLAIVRY